MLNELLNKLGLKFDELTAAEKETYTQWSQVLTVPDASIDDLKRFFAVEQDRADAECRNFENDPKKQMYYQMYASFLVNARAFIEGPGKQREALKQRLKKDFHIDV